MQLKRAGKLLLTSVAFILLFSAAVAYWSLDKVSELSRTAAAENQKVGHLLMTAAKVQTDFQVQIQEFKNILIRGDDLELWKKHRDSFKQRADLVQEGLDQISQAMEDVGMDKSAVEQLITAHSELTFRYTEAGKLVRGMGLAASGEADKSVRGMDRPTSQGLSELRKAIDQHASMMTEKRGHEIESTATQAHRWMLVTTLLGGLSVLLFIHIGMKRLLRQIGGEPSAAVEIFARMSSGDLGSEVPPAPSGSLMAELSSMQNQLNAKIQEEKRSAGQVMRIKRALDCAGVNMMLINDQGQIVYHNDSMENLLKKLAPALHCEPALPPEYDFGLLLQFTAEADWARALPTLETASRVSFVHDDFHLVLSAQPVRDTTGDPLGTVIEWQDNSANVEAEAHIQTLIDAALQGDFARQISLDDKTGFHRTSAESLNQLTCLMKTVLEEIGDMLNSLASGDLSRQMETEYQGLLDQLKGDTNATIHSLRDIVGQIRQAAETIGSAAREVAVGNTDISRRVEEQAGSLEETASAMEELNSTVRQNADNARRASQLSVVTNEFAQAGGASMVEITLMMQDIQASSRKIESIISVIDSIAFQTNILALNAAVEAARAGEQGRGFAVVATEVRNLAQRSSQAAREIKDLITESVDKVEGGVRLIDASGETMGKIVANFDELSRLVGDISVSTQEQATGISQVAQAVTLMDSATQQSAARVEEAAAAAQLLSDQANELNRMVDHFRLQPNPSGNRPTLRLAAPQALIEG